MTFKVCALANNAKTSQLRISGRVDPGKLDACGEEQRWTEGNSGRDEGSYKGPCDGPMQERTGWAEIGVSANSGDVAPHPADHDQMGEEYRGEPQPQRAG